MTLIVASAYQSVNPLTFGEIEVMKAIFYFPQKFWRLAVRYFHQHEQYSPDKLLRHFQQCLTNMQIILSTGVLIMNETTTIRVSREVYNTINFLAQQQNENIQDIVEEAVKEYKKKRFFNDLNNA